MCHTHTCKSWSDMTECSIERKRKTNTIYLQTILSRFPQPRFLCSLRNILVTIRKYEMYWCRHVIKLEGHINTHRIIHIYIKKNKKKRCTLQTAQRSVDSINGSNSKLCIVSVPDHCLSSTLTLSPHCFQGSDLGLQHRCTVGPPHIERKRNPLIGWPPGCTNVDPNDFGSFPPEDYS